jgi:hypothetical protein
MDHLQSDTINRIALSLDEDVYGANGDLTREQILDCVVDNIHAQTNYAYAKTGTVPLDAVARMIMGVGNTRIASA